MRLNRLVDSSSRRIRNAFRPKSVHLGLVQDLTRTRHQLLAENAALRHQLIVLSRTTKTPKLRPLDRVILVAVAAITSTWREAILLAKPQTILRWHRQGFRLFWRRRSRRRKPENRLSAEVVALVRRMANENVLWGAERIRGELLKLGISVSKRTIQRYMASGRKPGDGQRWTTFLKNHTVWACDFGVPQQAAREMGVGPPESPCRRRFQTTACGCVQKAWS